MTVTADRIPLAKGDDHAYAENHSVETTPNGKLEIYFQPQPRSYSIRQIEPKVTRWQRVASVTTILDALAAPMQWWGMRVGIAGIVELVQDGVDIGTLLHMENPEAIRKGDAKTLEKMLTAKSLCVNKVRDKAADRGTNVHSAMEAWAVTGELPNPEDFPPEEAGYVVALRAFLEHAKPVAEAFEVMVGSAKYGYAGRYDLRIRLDEPAVVLKTGLTTEGTPYKNPSKNTWTKIPAGTYLVDLKSAKHVYPKKNFRQLAAYEAAGIECGHPETDHQAVLHVTNFGVYQFKRSTATAKQFLRVLDVYHDDKELGS